MKLHQIALGFLALTSFSTATESALKPYPAPESGMVRHVLQLDPEEHEEDFRVELILGKTVDTDGVNRHFFAGKIQQHTVEGWGYSYHKLDELGPMAGTRMAPSPGKEKVKTFVRIGGNPYWVRYNSKLPVVVYVPKGVEVRYRIWSAKGDGESIPEA